MAECLGVGPNTCEAAKETPPPAPPPKAEAARKGTTKGTGADEFVPPLPERKTSPCINPEQRCQPSRKVDVPIESQGQTNGCGTTSLAAVLSHWGVPGQTREEIDKSIRKGDTFTAPDNILDYARGKGMRASLKNEASLDDMAKMIDQGAPPIVLMKPGSNTDMSLHYMVATGYQRDGAGKIDSVTFSDPARGRSITMKASEFMERWQNLQVGGVPTGLDRVLISMAPNDDRSVTGADGVQRKASSIELPDSTDGAALRAAFARISATVSSSAAQGFWGILDAARDSGR